MRDKSESENNERCDPIAHRDVNSRPRLDHKSLESAMLDFTMLTPLDMIDRGCRKVL